MDIKEFLQNISFISNVNFFVKYSDIKYGEMIENNYIEYSYLDDYIRVEDNSEKSKYVLNLIKSKLFDVDVIKTVIFEEIDEEFAEYLLNNPKYLNYEYYLYILESNNKSDEIIKGINSVLSVSYILKLDENRILILNKYDIGIDILDLITTQLMILIKIGYSQFHKNLYNLKLAYNEAKIALELVNVFSKDNIYKFNNSKLDLIIKGLINANINVEKIIGLLDEEDITTIQTFLDVNLNLSEASRKLYLHRNTLLYRLDKINKKTGLDIRNFDDALVVRIYLLLKYTKIKK